MSEPFTQPLKILTPYKVIQQDNWLGENPVNIQHATTLPEIVSSLPGTDVFISLSFTQEMTEAADSLKLIQCAGAGSEQIDLTAVPSGCQVAIVYGHESAVAEWVIMVMIALNRDLIKANRDVREANWELGIFRHTSPQELSEQTLGIIGLGHIGRQTAIYASALGMNVLTATRTIPNEEETRKLGVTLALGMDGLARILTESDFVLLSIPLLETTTGIIGEKELAMMKPSSCLVNAGRAGLVDEEALFNSLKNKQIKGAALDVWYHEPTTPTDKPMPSDFPFGELDNVLMTPHLASMTTGMLHKRMKLVADNIDRLARGEPLENVVYVGK